MDGRRAWRRWRKGLRVTCAWVTGLVTAAALAVLLPAGCQAPPGGKGGYARPASGQLPATDAMGLLRDALARAEELDGYRIVFHRRERLGLFGTLGDWEKLQVYFRKHPHAVKMTWLNTDSEYAQVVYTQGDGQVTVLPRKGPFGLPAQPAKVEPDAAVQWGKSLRPITDFGLENTMRETLARVEGAKPHGGANVRYEGLADVPKLGGRAHHVVIEYPKGFTRAARQDLYIDGQSGYPTGVYLWLPNGDLLAAYLYEPPEPMVPAMDVFAIVASDAGFR